MEEIKIKGRYSTASVFCHNVEETAMGQIYNTVNDPITEGSQVYFMPDVHYGNECNIGTCVIQSMDSPINLRWVSADIGCGMTMVEIEPVDLPSLDDIVRKTVPSGSSIFDEYQKSRMKNKSLEKIFNITDKQLNMFKQNTKIENLFYQSFATLGSGNHYIELGTLDGRYYLTIHTGSRGFGANVHKYFLKKMGQQQLISKFEIEEIKRKFTGKSIQDEIIKLTNSRQNIKRNIFEPELKREYIEAVNLASEWAKLSRYEILYRIVTALGQNFNKDSIVNSTHNFLTVEEGRVVIRKGSTPAHKDQILLIPLNMKDGTLLCKGLGNSKWGNTAPHGAGRALSRREAKELISLEDFKQDMEGIYTTCVNKSNIDESSFAYKDKNEIIHWIDGKTVDIIGVIKPLYNFKGTDVDIEEGEG